MINVLLTTRCNYLCAHCMFSCTEKGIDMDRHTLEAVTSLLRTHDSLSINIIGGEPTLHPKFGDYVSDLFANCCGATRRIVSNGSFVEDREKVREFQKMLSVSCYHFTESISVCISNDRYHREFWTKPKQNELARSLVMGEDEETGELVLDASMIIWERDDRDKLAFPVLPVGRALKNNLGKVSDFYYPACCVDFESWGVENADELPEYVLFNNITIMPNGDIQPCFDGYGITIGNITEQSIEEVEKALRAFTEHIGGEQAVISGVEALNRCQGCRKTYRKFSYRKGKYVRKK